jgi:hypothetical protein
MNTELKAMIQTVFDIVSVVKGAIAKENFVTALLPALYKIAADIPAVVSNWSDLQAEVSALSGASADADLVAFVVSQVAGVTSNAQAQSVISAALDLIVCVGQKAIALEQAIKNA